MIIYSKLLRPSAITISNEHYGYFIILEIQKSCPFTDGVALQSTDKTEMKCKCLKLSVLQKFEGLVESSGYYSKSSSDWFGVCVYLFFPVLNLEFSLKVFLVYVLLLPSAGSHLYCTTFFSA